MSFRIPFASVNLASATGVQDDASNMLSTVTFSGPSYTLDHVAPTLTAIDRSAPTDATTNASSVTYLVTSSEPVSGLTASNLTLMGTAASVGLIETPTTTDGGRSWTITIRNLSGASGTVVLVLANTTNILDSASQPLSANQGAIQGPTYTLDPIVPPIVPTTLDPVVPPIVPTLVSVQRGFSNQRLFRDWNSWKPRFRAAGRAVRLRMARVALGLGLSPAQIQQWPLSRVSVGARTNPASVSFLVIFSEPVSGVNAGNFRLSGSASSGTIGTPTTSEGGLTWSVPVSGLSQASGELQLTVENYEGVRGTTANLPRFQTYLGTSFVLDAQGGRPTGSILWQEFQATRQSFGALGRRIARVFRRFP